MRLRSIMCLTVALVALSISAQPRRTECLQWDQAYNQTVLLGTIGAAAVALVLALFIGLLFGRHLWWAAAPRGRIWIASLLIGYPISLFVIVIWPRVFGFGRLLFSSVDPQYSDCQATPFGAAGLFGGLIGEGIAAFAQWQAICAALLVASIVGGLVAWVVTEILVRTSGLARTAQGGEA